MRAARNQSTRRLSALVATAVLAVAGCGSATPTATSTRAAASSTPVIEEATPARPKAEVKRKEVAKKSRWTACDTNIDALQPHTSCPFAQNAFYEYWAADGDSPLQVYSPVVGRSFTTKCEDQGFQILCSTGDGGRVRFSSSAVAEYDAKQAGTYAETHDTGTDSTSALAGYDDTDTSDTLGYDDTETYDDSSTYDEPSYDESGADDSTGDEIPNYDNGTGYRVQCADGMYSQSGGKQGACSGHGGVGD